MILRVARLSYQPFGLFQGLSQRLAVALPQRQGCDRQRFFVFQTDQRKVISGRGGRDDPTITVRLQLFAQFAVDQGLDIVGLILPRLITRHEAQSDGFIQLPRRCQHAVAGGQRQVWGDQRGGTQIAAGGFDLADGLPRLGGGIRDLDSFIFAEKQTRLLGLGRAVCACRLRSDERE